MLRGSGSRRRRGRRRSCDVSEFVVFSGRCLRCYEGMICFFFFGAVDYLVFCYFCEP